MPLLGNLIEFRRDPIALLRRVAAVGVARSSPLTMFHLGRRPVVLGVTPDIARALLVEEADAFEKGPAVREFAAPLFGDGLVSCGTDEHHGRRQHLAPLFTPHHLTRAWQPMVAELERARQRFAIGAVLDLPLEMRRLTLAIIGRVLFSVDLLGEGQELSGALGEVNRFVTGRIRNPWAPDIDSIFWPGPRRARRALAQLDGAVASLIQERRAHPDRYDDLLVHLLRQRTAANEPLSDRRVRDEVVTLLAAGHETTAAALTWTVVLLARHPEVAAQLGAELDGVDLTSPGALDGCKLLDRVLKESLRLFPPVHTLGRETRRPVRLGGYLLPAKTIVTVSVFLLHRNRDLYAAPDHFEPQRFTAANEANIPRYGYVPFGAGPRACLGGALAMMEMRVCLAGLLGRVKFHLRNRGEVLPELMVTLRPRGSVRAEIIAGNHG